VAIEGNPFSEVKVNATDPSPTPSLAADAYSKSPFTLGAKVGIAIGGFFLILALGGCCIIWRGKRRRRRFLSRLATAPGHKGWPSTSTGRPDMHETPVSQRPLRGWDDSPMSVQTDHTYPRYFSPYSSQYNSPISAVDGPSMPWPTATSPGVSPISPEKGKVHEIGLAFGGNENSGLWDLKGSNPDLIKGKEKAESYEMHSVDSSDAGGNPRMPAEPEPPAIRHPGYGRAGGSPPKRYATLTEDDARRGFAL
jgi:hypothetical protein